MCASMPADQHWESAFPAGQLSSRFPGRPTLHAGVLGPLIFSDSGFPLVPQTPKPRQLLAYLMLNANQMVRATDCITELWGSDPPKAATSTLQTHIMHIRRILRGDSRARPPDASQALLTRNLGYELVLQLGNCDRWRFESAVRCARAVACSGDDEMASLLFADALALWRGPALDDVQVGPLAVTHLMLLEETRQYALEQRIAADLRLGRHNAVVDELAELTALHPTHENLHAQFMLALYHCGQRVAALRAFRQLHEALCDRLGIEPMPSIRQLRDAILAGRLPTGIASRRRSAHLGAADDPVEGDHVRR
jgi:DNA-binding SARP family transcriptional activator